MTVTFPEVTCGVRCRLRAKCI